jgi:hypothetical protein
MQLHLTETEDSSELVISTLAGQEGACYVLDYHGGGH